MGIVSTRKILLVVFVFIAAGFCANSIYAQDAQPDAAVDTSASEKQTNTPSPSNTAAPEKQTKTPPAPSTAEAQTQPKTADAAAPASDEARTADVAASASDEARTTADTSSGNDVQAVLKKMQAQLDAQAKLIADLQTQHASEVDDRQKEIDKQGKQLTEQTKKIDTQRQAIQSLQQQVDSSKELADTDISDSEKKLRSRLETVEDSIKSSESESSTYDLESFPGSLAIPGSSAAIKFGGFVKMNVVESFDPIGTNDRFIVGSIPVPQESGSNTAALTVSQSRLNIDMRDMTQYGAMRAFVEADFAGDGDTFRLRHAFGQYKSFLIGKTWSTFIDIRSRPEDLDFEGINGQLLLRHPQIRYFPQIGKNWHLLLAAEDPDPNIFGGTGISQVPDLVASVERTWFDKWHIKSSLLLRQISGECNCLDNAFDTTTGWAFTVSGMTNIARWDERDNLQLQLNYGEGYSHYVNDLGSVGIPDALFDPQTGNLNALPVFAMYIAFQKWWSPTMRSNFNYGYVNVDSKYASLPTQYKSTQRFIMNYIWSPIARIDLGAEFLMGSRTNQNGDIGKAKQIQLSAKYRY
jgi:hypothetical protein